MDLRKRILTKNNCFITSKKITVSGLMLHSTGANNPKLSRYVDAPDLGKISPNHWNQPRPDGMSKCVHGFIGLTPENTVATYQTLDWNHRGWGGGGTSNDTHIHVEICEDNLKDADYFKKVYVEAVELFTYLCKKFNLTEKDIITHSEGHKRGIASNHADVMHWFPKHGKSMDTFRNDVKYLLNVSSTPNTQPSPRPTTKSIDDLAQEVIAGKHGSGDARKKSLGSNYDAVQNRVNELLSGKPKPKPVKTIKQLADEVMAGLHGSGRERMISLGQNYTAVQQEVNRRVRN